MLDLREYKGEIFLESGTGLVMYAYDGTPFTNRGGDLVGAAPCLFDWQKHPEHTECGYYIMDGRMFRMLKGVK